MFSAIDNKPCLGIIRGSISSMPVYWLADRNKTQSRAVVSLEIWSGLNADQLCLPGVRLSLPFFIMSRTLSPFKGQAKQKVHSCGVVANVQFVAYLCWTFCESCYCVTAQWLRVRSESNVCDMCCCSCRLHSTPLFFSQPFLLSVHISDYSSHSRQATRSEYKNRADEMQI